MPGTDVMQHTGPPSRVIKPSSGWVVVTLWNFQPFLAKHLALPFTGCVTLHWTFPLSGLQFSLAENVAVAGLYHSWGS